MMTNQLVYILYINIKLTTDAIFFARIRIDITSKFRNKPNNKSINLLTLSIYRCSACLK